MCIVCYCVIVVFVVEELHTSARDGSAGEGTGEDGEGRAGDGQGV